MTTETTTLTRRDLESDLRAGAGLTSAQAKQVLDILEHSVSDALVNGLRVRLLGLGVLQVKDTPAKQGTIAGTPYSKPAGKRVAFAPGSTLKAAVNPA